MSYCRWVNDREAGRVLIPGCMGSAVYGPDGCTCNLKRRRKEIEDRMEALEAKVKLLEQNRHSR